MQNYYAARKWKRLPQSDCPAYSPVREAKTGIPSVSPAYRGIKMEWLWSERPLIIPVIPLGRGGGAVGGGFKWLVYESTFQIHAKMTNETPICFSITSNAKTKNEIQIRFSKWCENEKRKLKFISVFQSEAKTKKEIRSSNPFFKVKRKRKTKSKIQICFSMSCENEKCKWHLNALFPCHRKTVGTKVHIFLSLEKYTKCGKRKRANAITD